jgi:ankyrin repeat protein
VVDDLLRGTGLLNATRRQSAVLLAAYYGQAQILKDLLCPGAVLTPRGRRHRRDSPPASAWSAEARTTAFSPDGYTALGLASFFGHLQAVNLLLGRRQVNVASRNEMNVMPLHSAVAGRHLAVAKVLLEHGAIRTPFPTPAGRRSMAPPTTVTCLWCECCWPMALSRIPATSDGLTPADLAQAKAHVGRSNC